MKSFRQMKKWTLMSVLLCGISLAAYAIVTQPRILTCTLTNILPTSVDLFIEHQGAEYLLIDLCTPDGELIARHLDKIEEIDAEATLTSMYNAYNLIPNTEYRIEIVVIGFSEQPESQYSDDMMTISFRTPSE